MAGWAYQAFGEDQFNAQNDQLRMVEAKGKLRELKRKDEAMAFHAAAQGSKTLNDEAGSSAAGAPAPRAGPAVPNAASASKKASKRPTLPACLAASVSKKRSACETSEGDASSGTASAAVQGAEADAKCPKLASEPAAAAAGGANALSGLLGYTSDTSEEDEGSTGQAEEGECGE